MSGYENGECRIELMASKAIQQLEERMADLQPGSLRHQTLEAAKRFKTSWIELGRVLWTVYREKKFREWGYLTFEAYCAKEVGIRAATAKKLLHSYYFLEKEEPSTLKRLTEAAPPSLPSVDSVNLLRLLKNRDEVPAADYQKVRSYVLEKGKEAPEVRKEVQALLQDKSADPEAVQEARTKSTVRRMIGTLRALRQQLTGVELVPKKLLDEVEGLTKKLEGLL